MKIKSPLLYDRWLLLSASVILCMGLVMVGSASMVISDRIYGQPFYFLLHQSIYIIVGVTLGWTLFRLRLSDWQKLSGQFLIASFLLLSLVLIHGIGHQVNGSMRWLGIGPLGFQISEFAKFAVILYLASYLVRREKEVQSRIRGFLKPLLVIGLMSILLLKEPDFGATAVISATALGMLFLAGVRVWQFIILAGFALFTFGLLAVSSPYRLHRLTAFMHPWENAYASGYQLTQSLMAFGHGGLLGVGLGNSIQKLFYLPEAYTDFLFAVLAEELGLIGACFILTLFCIVITRAFLIGYASFQQKLYYGAYTAYGIGLMLGIQTIINIGVNIGLFPTKGLTLPFMSYGGSSMIINCVALTLLLRIDHETRIHQLGLQREAWPPS